jgi:hypothetical protein
MIGCSISGGSPPGCFFVPNIPSFVVVVAANLMIPLLTESGLFLFGESLCSNRDAGGTSSTDVGTILSISYCSFL